MKILIVGLGSIATKHIIAIRKLILNPEIYALRSNLEANKVEGIINIFDLNDETLEFDFALISNPTQNHEEYIEKLSKKNIDLFIEKPPVSSLLNIHELARKINEKNIKTYVACNLRFHPCLVFLKKQLETKENCVINEVNIYCGSYLPEWRPNQDFRKNYSANPEMGGGVHLDLFHEIDYSHWLFGKPENMHCVKRNVSSLNIEAIDSANYILEYPRYNINIVLNYFRRDSKRSIEILFEDDTWTIDLLKNSIEDSENEIIFQAEDFTILDTYDSQMNYFINGLKNNQKQMNTFADSIEILKTCLNND